MVWAAHVATCTGGSTNAAPVFTAALTSQTVSIGAPFTFDYDASDSDAADVVTYSLVQGPAGSTLDVATGVFAWTPTMAQAGQSLRRARRRNVTARPRRRPRRRSR